MFPVPVRMACVTIPRQVDISVPVTVASSPATIDADVWVSEGNIEIAEYIGENLYKLLLTFN